MRIGNVAPVQIAIQKSGAFCFPIIILIAILLFGGIWIIGQAFNEVRQDGYRYINGNSVSFTTCTHGS